MGRGDSKEDKKGASSKKESGSRKESGSSYRDVPSSKGRHKSEKEKSIPIQSRKAKETANAEDDYNDIAEIPVRSGGFESIGARFGTSPQTTTFEGEEDIDLPISFTGAIDGTYDSSTLPVIQQYSLSALLGSPGSDTSDLLSNRSDRVQLSEVYEDDKQDSNGTKERPPAPRRPTQNKENKAYRASKKTGKANAPNSKARSVALTHFAQQEKFQDKFKHTLKKKQYKIWDSKEFIKGRIIKLWWVEPLGRGDRRDFASIDMDESPTLFRESPGKLRRFVIIGNRRGHCTCVPVNTYQQQGTTKNGCHPEDHAMLYTIPWPNRLPESTEPYPPYIERRVVVDGREEIRRENMRNERIQMAQYDGSEILDRASRINYAKKYTIEHNFHVRFIGEIAHNSTDAFWATYERVNSPQNELNPPSASAPAAAPALPPPPPQPPAAGPSATSSQGWQRQQEQQFANAQRSYMASEAYPMQTASYPAQNIATSPWASEAPRISQGLPYASSGYPSGGSGYQNATLQTASSSSTRRATQYYPGQYPDLDENQDQDQDQNQNQNQY